MTCVTILSETNREFTFADDFSDDTCSITIKVIQKKYENGKLYFSDDLKKNIENGDKNYLDLLDEADEYIKKNNLSFPEEPETRNIISEHSFMTKPILELNIEESVSHR